MGGKDASERLGVHQRTLYKWDELGLIETIRTPGNKRFYNVDKYLQEMAKIEILDDGIKEDGKEKLNISYARVSSIGQKNDLERQKAILKSKYPTHIMIEDIGSGINLNRKGLKKIIKLAISGRINQVVVAYKDRLTRFGFELIESIINDYSGGKIIIINKKENQGLEEELVSDVLEIMNVFVAKMNGIRKYKKKAQKTDNNDSKVDIS